AELKTAQKSHPAASRKLLTLVEPLSGPRAKLGLRYAGWSLGSALQYNVYKRANEKASFSLSPPSVFDTRLSLGYVLEKELHQDLSFVLTRTQRVGLTTKIVR